MQQASFSDVLQVVLIILLIYFGLKIFFRYFGPLILKYFLKKVIGKQMEKRFGKFDQFQGQQPPKQEPKKDPVKRKSKKPVGEYIDYEEID